MTSLLLRWSSIAAFCLALFCVSGVGRALADVPQTMTYKGYLTDDKGKPLVGSISMAFAIYDAETGGTALWGETLAVAMQNGHFTVILGLNTPVDVSVFTGKKALYMGVKVGQDPEMTPRARLTSVPFARVAQTLAPGAAIDVSGLKVGGQEIVNSKGEWVGSTASLKGEKGEKGDKGDKGDKGAVGPAGPAGSVKAVSCPEGLVLKGIDAQGAPICSNQYGAVTPYKAAPTYKTLPSNFQTSGSSLLGIHAFNDNTVAAVLYESASYRVRVYYTTNGGTSWATGATFLPANVSATRFSSRYLYQAGASSLIFVWRDTTNSRSGVVQIYNSGRSYKNAVQMGNSQYTLGGACNDSGVCVVYSGYNSSSTYYYRVFTSGNGGSTWRQTWTGSGTNARWRGLVASGTRFYFIYYYTSGSTVYRFYRSTTSAATAWSLSSISPATSASFRYVQGDIVTLSSTPRLRSTNGGSTFTQGSPDFFTFASTTSTSCQPNTTTKEIFCTNCNYRTEPGLALPYKCVQMPSGVSSFPRTAVSPSGKIVYYSDGIYLYRWAR